MITGTVTADHEAIVNLVVIDPGGTRHEIGALVNTGFTGWVTLPPSLIAAMGLYWREVNRAVLADGRGILTDVYDATVEWDRRTIPIKIHEIDAFPLVGMGLLRGYELIFPVNEGSTFTLRTLLPDE